SAQVWPGWSAFPDFTNSDARKWWGDQFKVYTDAGIQGFWNDMNEPACWGQMPPNLIQFDFDGEGATHLQARNVYGMQMARATRAGTEAQMNGERPFILTRAGFSGVQRYAAVWTGDNVATDDHMVAGVRLVNSLGLTGVPFSGYDVGGFCGEASPGLFARWIAIGAFSPFFRGHSMINSRDSEPWAYGEEVEEIARNFIGFRYQLMPYLYSVFHEAARSGAPISRSMAFDAPHDPNIYTAPYDAQYCFGPSILVAPIPSGKDLAKVYLPEGDWYAMANDKPHAGGQAHVCELAIDTLPLFVKAGAIVPMQSLVQSTDEAPDGVLRLHVYAGGEETVFACVEDDGLTRGGVELRREWRHLPDARALHCSAGEGEFVSGFERVRVYLHGVSDANVMVDGEAVDVVAEDVVWMQPISKFDPLGPPAGEAYGPAGVLAFEVDWGLGEMEIRY
ncbi:MAG: glycoside hydrolase family 31 protein, partial [Bacteroidota bacterium]